MTTNFEPHECLIFLQSTKIITHENKTIHNIDEIKSVCISPAFLSIEVASENVNSDTMQ